MQEVHGTFDQYETDVDLATAEGLFHQNLNAKQTKLIFQSEIKIKQNFTKIVCRWNENELLLSHWNLESSAT